MCCNVFFLQAEDGIRYLVRSRGLGDVYKRQELIGAIWRIEPSPKYSRLMSTAGKINGMAEEANKLSLIHI